VPIPLSCRAAAFDYLGRGWAVIPIQARGKRPLVTWIEYQSRLPRREEVEAWFGRGTSHNLGIVTGVVSSLVVLDVDPAHGGDSSLADLERRHGPLPRTTESRTGGGGRHLYFSHPRGHVPNRVGLAAGLDIRGDGGCVVAPPSVHPNGNRYAWLPGRSPAAVAPAALPVWLLQLVRPTGPRMGHPPEHWRRLVEAGVAEGERNDTIASLAGHLLWYDVDVEVVLELMLAWNRMRCRPPLPDEEVARVVGSIGRLHAERDHRR
jgi:hypothetical protein